MPEDLPRRGSYESLIGPAYDQGQTFECVCYTLAGMKRYHEYRESGAWLTFDPHELYERCKAVDGVAGSGTFPRVAMDILRTDGMLANDGKRYTIAAAARLGSVDEIRACLHRQGPVLVGLRIDEVEFSSLMSGQVDLSQVNPAHFAGHAMLIVGYDEDAKAFRVRNSWGSSWGDNGHLWMPYDYLVSTDPQFDAWSAVDAS